VMGPSIMAAAALWGLCSTPRRRLAAFLTATLATTLLTPIVRTTSWLAALPDPLEAYLRPAGVYSGFPAFPWAGFVFAGGLLGVLLDSRTVAAPRADARLNTWFGIGGAALALAAYAGSFVPTVYARSDFWTSSPTFFLLRLGLLTMAVGLAFAWERRPWSRGGWSWVQQLGRTSLFVYWIHVELVYGLISIPIHHRLTLGQSCVALVLFSGLMLYLSLVKDRYVASRRARRGPLPSSRPATLT
jgi:surface polysaccharide O-acyltransferase-like enzyme